MPCQRIPQGLPLPTDNDGNPLPGYDTIEECQNNCTEFYVVCSVRTQPMQRIAAGSNYESISFTGNPPTLPRVIRTTGFEWYWAVSIMAGPYSTQDEARAWIDENGNGGIGSIECYPSGTSF